MSGQRRGTAIAMTDPERDTFLRTQPLCRVATVGRNGDPHVSALWFVWDGSTLWLNSLVRSQRWTDLDRDPRLSVIVDDGGTDFMALRGIELRGSIEVVGEAPCKGDPWTNSCTPNGSSRTSTWAAARSGTTGSTAGSGSLRRRS